MTWADHIKKANNIRAPPKKVVWWWDFLDGGYNEKECEVLQGPMSQTLYNIRNPPKRAIWWWDFRDSTCSEDEYDVLEGPMTQALFAERAWKRAEAAWSAVRPTSKLSSHTGSTEDYLISRETELNNRGGAPLVSAWLDLIGIK
jgi:hypothetical protein